MGFRKAATWKKIGLGPQVQWLINNQLSEIPICHHLIAMSIDDHLLHSVILYYLPYFLDPMNEMVMLLNVLMPEHIDIIYM